MDEMKLVVGVDKFRLFYFFQMKSALPAGEVRLQKQPWIVKFPIFPAISKLHENIFGELWWKF